MPSHLASTVGANLRAAAEAKGLTQRQVSDELSATPAQVSNWFRGEYEPGPAYRVKLADLLTDGDVGALYRKQAA